MQGTLPQRCEALSRTVGLLNVMKINGIACVRCFFVQLVRFCVLYPAFVH